MTRTIPEISTETRLIIQHFQKCRAERPDGDITHVELSALIDENVQAKARHRIRTALKHMLHDGAVYASVPRVGYRLLRDEQIAGVGEAALAHIGRTSRVTRRKLAAVEKWDGMSAEAKTRHNTMASIHGVIEHFTRPRRVKLIAAKVKEASEELIVQKTIEAFSS